MSRANYRATPLGVANIPGHYCGPRVACARDLHLVLFIIVGTVWAPD